jgi:hypothetical protein
LIGDISFQFWPILSCCGLQPQLLRICTEIWYRKLDQWWLGSWWVLRHSDCNFYGFWLFNILLLLYTDVKQSPGRWLLEMNFITGQNERGETTQNTIVTKSAACASYKSNYVTYITATYTRAKRRWHGATNSPCCASCVPKTNRAPGKIRFAATLKTGETTTVSRLDGDLKSGRCRCYIA